MNSGILKKGIDLGKKLKDKFNSSDKISGEELFVKYLESIKNEFFKELYKNVRDGYTSDDRVYDLCVDALCQYKVSREKGKLFIQLRLTDLLDYHLMSSSEMIKSLHGEELGGESKGEMLYLGNLNDLKTSNKLVKMDLDNFFYEIRKNGFTYVMDVDRENLEMIPEGEYSCGELTISKNFINIPRKTAEEKARRRLTLSKIYSNNKKMF